MDNLALIEDRFGTDHKSASHGELTFNCPFCYVKRGKADTDHKLYVNTKSLKFHCFKCGTSGRLKTATKTDISDDVLKKVFDFVNQKDSDVIGSEDDDDSEDNMFYLPVTKILPGTVAYNYCIKRGITEDLIDFYDIRLGVSDLAGRIVIPNNVYGSCWTDMYSARTVIDQIPKYKNPTGVNKNNIVFNLKNIKDGQDKVIIVEGVITAICGGKDCVAVFGCHPTEVQLNQIIAKNPKAIYCCLDGDSAGQSGMLPMLEYLSNHYDGEIFYIKMPVDKDACDLGYRLYRKYIELHKQKFINKMMYELNNYFAE